MVLQGDVHLSRIIVSTLVNNVPGYKAKRESPPCAPFPPAGFIRYPIEHYTDMDADDRAEIEQILGYHFFEPQHLIRALTHPACANEMLQQNKRCMDQEAYSTLGDAVLKTVLILCLMERGLETKGEITVNKEPVEKNETLAKVGRRLKIRRFIQLGRGEKELMRHGEETILADTVEALIGAIFLDSDQGFGVVTQCIGVWLAPELTKIKKGSAVPPPLTPRLSRPLSSSRRGAPRGKRPGSRSPWRG